MAEKIQVAVIGAGPAGLFAAEKLASLGYGVALFNRDVKPGGMAEYGIYPDKHAVKDGLRKQFNHILSCDQVHYYGNICVGEGRSLSIPDLLDWGFPAVLVACGAQGTKWLGLPGEKLSGVYHAKDVVYHYNRLPPFSTMPITIGKRVVIVGAGNVMADVARYLIHQEQVEEVHICVRRGPAEVKFTRKELETIIGAFDLGNLEREIGRVAPAMQALDQDPTQELAFFHSALTNAETYSGKAKILMHFLVSPLEITGDSNGRMNGLLLEDNTLVGDKENTSARGLGTKWNLEADTVIFAIGDKVEAELGLPLSRNDYRHAEQPAFPVDGQSYEVEDPTGEKPWTGVFLAGWSRVASSGLVGNAKRDGVNAACAIDQYLRSAGKDGLELEVVDERVDAFECPVVRKDDLKRLLEDEHRRAESGTPETAKYLTNEDMLMVMGLK